MVYFVQPKSGGLIKIGTSLKLSVRLKALAKEAGCPLVVLGVVKGEQRKEKELHHRFAIHRERGEWFRPAPELIRYISRHTRRWDGEDECVRPRTKVPHLDIKIPAEFFDRVTTQADRYGLDLKSYVRLAVTNRIEIDERSLRHKR